MFNNGLKSSGSLCSCQSIPMKVKSVDVSAHITPQVLGRDLDSFQIWMDTYLIQGWCRREWRGWGKHNPCQRWTCLSTPRGRCRRSRWFHRLKWKDWSGWRTIGSSHSPTMWIMKEAKTTHQPQPPSGGLTLVMLSVSSSLIATKGFCLPSAFSPPPVFVGESPLQARLETSGPRGLSVEPAISQVSRG